MNKFYFILITLLLTCVGCKRFDGDKLNRQLIQGKWQQVEIIFPDVERKSIVTEQPEGTTLLHFVGDSCIEELADIRVIRRYNFLIKDYELTMFEKGNDPHILEIDKLTKDSLLLQIQHRMWKYIKVKEADQ